MGRDVDRVEIRAVPLGSPLSGVPPSVRTASVLPSGENAIASPGIEPLSATGLPVGIQRDMSSKRTTPAESLVASSFPLRSTAKDVIWFCDAPDIPDREGVVLEFLEQVAAGLQSVLELDSGDRVEHREIQVLLDQRLSPDSLGVGGECLRYGVAALRLCVASLDQRDHAGERRDEQKGDGSSQQPAQAAVGAQLGVALPVGLLEACVEEARARWR